jgi:protocatechuate 3,4-dioxygenase alpha subunit
VADALIELWQANTAGHYDHPEDPGYLPATTGGFGGFGRCYTGTNGEFSFVTVKPGRVPGYDERLQAPHVVVTVFARGLLRRLVTRVYFPEEISANASDPVLTSIEDDKVRRTLIAQPAGPRRLRFDIHLRGQKETAFFAI